MGKKLKEEEREEEEGYLTARNSAKFIGMATQTLANRRSKGLPPPYCKINKAVRYKRSDLIQFMESNKILPREQG